MIFSWVIILIIVFVAFSFMGKSFHPGRSIQTLRLHWILAVYVAILLLSVPVYSFIADEHFVHGETEMSGYMPIEMNGSDLQDEIKWTRISKEFTITQFLGRDSFDQFGRSMHMPGPGIFYLRIPADVEVIPNESLNIVIVDE